MKIRMVTVGSLSALIAASPAYAADVDANWHHGGTLPAVSRTNFKLGLSGGFVDLDNEDSGGRVQLEGSYTTPLSHATGLQIDASIGALDDEATGSAAAHLFTRDPASYLVGAWGGWAAVGSNDIFRVGPEVALYMGQFTIEGTAGYEDSDTNGDDAYVFANFAYYPTDDVKLYAGYRRSLGRDAGALGFEWQVGDVFGVQTPVSVFAEGQVGDDDHATIWAGLRMYFGDQDKSLIRRHREDDPVDPSQALNQLEGEQCLVAVPEDGKAMTVTCAQFNMLMAK
ncbi:MAG: hypothetical protein KDJ62_13745 [Rhodobiaceae bacterium]|nr:hypothetical protein [Rhodobiaceae bacterium]